jgi:excinuclease UvrABC helicase subunit UvrB
MSRRDVIVACFCIYGIGNPEAYGRVVINLNPAKFTGETRCCASW